MDQNVERSARLAIKQHGAAAADHGREQARLLLRKGHVSASLEWTKIVARIIELQRSQLDDEAP